MPQFNDMWSMTKMKNLMHNREKLRNYHTSLFIQETINKMLIGLSLYSTKVQLQYRSTILLDDLIWPTSWRWSERGGPLPFYLKLADWLESWTCSNFCLSKQTSSLLVIALRSQAMIIKKSSVGKIHVFVDSEVAKWSDWKVIQSV